MYLFQIYTSATLHAKPWSPLNSSKPLISYQLQQRQKISSLWLRPWNEPWHHAVALSPWWPPGWPWRWSPRPRRKWSTLVKQSGEKNVQNVPQKSQKFITRWWFQMFLLVSSLPGEMIQFWLIFFNIFLKPPARGTGLKFLFCRGHIDGWCLFCFSGGRGYKIWFD